MTNGNDDWKAGPNTRMPVPRRQPPQERDEDDGGYLPTQNEDAHPGASEAFHPGGLIVPGAVEEGDGRLTMDPGAMPPDREIVFGNGKVRIPVEPHLRNPKVPWDSPLPLSSGWTVREAHDQTMAWWSRIGAKTMRNMRASQVKRVRGQRTTWGPFSNDPDNPNFFPSNIMHGKPWDQLGEWDKRFMIEVWHFLNVARRDIGMGITAPRRPKGGLIAQPKQGKSS